MHRKLVLALTGIAVLGLGMSWSFTLRAVEKTPLDILVEPNSCVIHCPKESPYPSLAAAVGCATGTTAVCQCGDATRRMAYCEIRRP